MDKVKTLIVFIAMFLFSSMANAALVSQTINSEKSFSLKDKKMEAVSGEFIFLIDPKNPSNKQIVDIDKAPTNSDGLVEAKANFFIIQNKDPKQRRGALVEVSNRGSKASLRYFNHARNSDSPNKASLLGDGLIQDLGLSLVWVGWQGDLTVNANNMHASLPRIHGLDGWVRSDWTVDTAKSLLTLAHKKGVETIYPVDFAKQQDAWLTKRMGRDNLRAVVPHSMWQFSSDGKHIAGDFSPGIYELVYPSRAPMVTGIGLAILRDTSAYIKQVDSAFSVPKTIAFGVSQTGRFLRHFLHQGFNETEMGTMAFDGMLIHTAGAGRGSFNHRFAQPSRDAHRMSAFLYPTDVFPFTSARVRSNITNKKLGLLKRHHEDFYPKIFYTNTGYEYWGRAAGLIHTHNVFDMAPLKNERIYHFASAQHFVENPNDLTLLNEKTGLFRGNPLDFKLHLRALLSHLTNWVVSDEEPPKSAYPRFADQTLTTFSHYQLPEWLNMEKPFKPHTAYEVDYGKTWEQGIITNQPPVILAEIMPPVPKVDNNGHELGGINHPLIKAPIATFLPWVLRYNKFSNNEIEDFRGAVKKWTKKRIYSRYSDKKSYLNHLNKMTLKSLAEGWILARDVSRVKQQGSWLWDWSMDQPDPIYASVGENSLEE
ncbi:alpha/beta hydrolase domain-containing protein [Thalassotalea fonticola]|uniref:Alpha/beta hydrolase domain-containing protein n=1 Tax=Thalassotalea fonticola TaxID=3065649 RepID=A0ABZ0GLR3_9GAMM|nr:alpha/beta hydrolase domain-containing protein [Colwelliaceae bacterium S1-1]